MRIYKGESGLVLGFCNEPAIETGFVYEVELVKKVGKSALPDFFSENNAFDNSANDTIESIISTGVHLFTEEEYGMEFQDYEKYSASGKRLNLDIDLKINELMNLVYDGKLESAKTFISEKFNDLQHRDIELLRASQMIRTKEILISKKK